MDVGTNVLIILLDDVGFGASSTFGGPCRTPTADRLAFSHGFHPEHSQRLAAYWGESLGGPTTFTDRYGDETSVVRIHSGNGLHKEMDRRAIVCFDQALADVALADNRVGRVLHNYFAWATTTVMSRYHRSADDVPGGTADS